MQAKGQFEVNLQPLDSYAKGSGGIALGRMSIDKVFRGDLEAQSQGEMLSAMTAVEGSAGYVAVEQVTGTLAGRRGPRHHRLRQLCNECAAYGKRFQRGRGADE